MLAAQYGTISDIEIIWIALALFGLFYSTRNALEANKDCKTLKRAGVRNGRRKIALTVRFQDAARAAIHSIFATIGFLAALLPDPPNQLNLPWKQQVVSVLIRWGLIFGSAILVAQSFASNRLRKELLERERAEAEELLASEKLQASMDKLITYADEADARRLSGDHAERDVAREKEHHD